MLELLIAFQNITEVISCHKSHHQKIIILFHSLVGSDSKLEVFLIGSYRQGVGNDRVLIKYYFIEVCLIICFIFFLVQ